MKVYVLCANKEDGLDWVAGVVTDEEAAESWVQENRGATTGQRGRYIPFELDEILWPKRSWSHEATVAERAG